MPFPSPSRRRARRAILPAAIALLLVASTAALAAQPPATARAARVDVQILSINDFHGNLEPPAGSSGRIGTINAGGVEYLATHVRALEATNPNTVVVSAGDLIGASPLLSALFHDEPSIEAMNLIGLDFNAVGNHEFDEGAAELLRMQEGGCHPVDGCLDGDDFAGADFRFLAANVVREDNGKTLFPAYKVRSFAGAKVAFIGIVARGHADHRHARPASPASTFLDEADTVNALVPELKAKGVESIVVLIHEGGAQAGTGPVQRLRRHLGRDRRHRQPLQPRGRRRSLGPHAQRLQLHDQQHACDERQLVRADRDGRRPDDRSSDTGSRFDVGGEQDRDPRRREGRRRDGAHRQVQRDRRAAREPDHRLDHGDDHPHQQRRRRIRPR